MSTTENNTLIAKFMGRIIPEEQLEFLDENPTTHYYHSNWNWLMEVVDKVESLGNEVLINTHYIQISFDEGEQFVVIEEVNVKIQGVYLALVEFIKLYNQNNQ